MITDQEKQAVVDSIKNWPEYQDFQNWVSCRESCLYESIKLEEKNFLEKYG